ncbi:MAG: phage holin family protein [Polyangiaceae bacterium]|nr:phage holin family protein [Polyangiaceae bacterium]
MTPHDSSVTSAPAEVIHGALDLLRAEIKVGVAHARAFGVHAGIAVVLALFSAVVLQAAVILTVLSPLWFDHLPVSRALLALAAPYVAAVLAAGGAYLVWRKACEPPPFRDIHHPHLQVRNNDDERARKSEAL